MDVRFNVNLLGVRFTERQKCDKINHTDSAAPLSLDDFDGTSAQNGGTGNTYGKWMKGRYMANQKRLSVGTGVPAPRGRGIVMLILLALVVALAAVSVTTVAKLSSVNSRNIAMMQEQCRDAVALSTTLSRTASSSSAATVGKIRADVHAIDVINQMKMLQDGTNHAYVSTELISRIYTILDAYSNQLITGMSTMEEQTNLSAALQELSAALSGL